MLNIPKIPHKKCVKIKLNDIDQAKVFMGMEYMVVGCREVARNLQARSQVVIGLQCVNLTDLQKQQDKLKPVKGAFSIVITVSVATLRKIPLGSIFVRQQDVLRLTHTLDLPTFTYQLQHPTNTETSSLLHTIEPLTTMLDNALLYDALSPQSHAFKVYNQDKHHYIVTTDSTQQKTFLLHSVYLLACHYGASSEVVRILLSEPTWQDVLKRFNYDYLNSNNPKSVLISDKLALSDCVFLHHLKHDEYTFNVVKALHSQVSRYLINTNKAWLKVVPYHNQSVSLTVKGLVVGDFVWVTEICAISEPMGDAVYFDVVVRDRQKPSTFQVPKLLARTIRDENILIGCEQVNNRDVAVVKSGIGMINEAMRDKLLNERIQSSQELLTTKTSYVVNNEAALRFAMGERMGNEGEVGFLSIMNGEVIFDEMTTPLQTQYRTLINLAHDHFNSVYGYTPNRGITAPTAIRFMYQRSYPQTTLVLICTSTEGKVVFIDCEKIEQMSSAGLIFSWHTSWRDEGVFKEFIVNTLQVLANNTGVLSTDWQEELFDNHIKWAKYNHTQNGDWVKNGLANLLGYH